MKMNDINSLILHLLQRLENRDLKLSEVLESCPAQFYASARIACLNVEKNREVVAYYLSQCLRKKPKTLLRNFFYWALSSLWQDYREGSLSAEKFAPVVNAWVERSKSLFSKPEVRFINAVLRPCFQRFCEINTLNDSIRFSTPVWLIRRWEGIYGKTAVGKLLEWNASRIQNYLRIDRDDLPFLQKTPWQYFFAYRYEDWPKVRALVQSREGYIQDPMTRYPVELLQVEKGQQVLDLCASPGGKTVNIAQRLQGEGFIVAVDLERRIQRLKSNLQDYKNVKVLGQDVLQLMPEFLRKEQCPDTFDRILLDVPCSNTGVLRRRPDVKWRLTEKDFEDLPALQCQLLTQAVRFLRPNGRLVYSTCSIEPEENQLLIETFLKGNKAFRLVDSHMCLPWIDGHDGGGTFVLMRKDL